MDRVVSAISKCTQELSKWYTRSRVRMRVDIVKLQREMSAASESIQPGSCGGNTEAGRKVSLRLRIRGLPMWVRP
ncbi:hypothetical protein Ddye_030075 [Dipteronia dyeriana]|uniref:Uncharacterized protein n=1 Tax=Dipteronia dyeriana TaxID=168575 RepID=A0AAD9WMD7_9ROSI|nr:hypothetical protein Ddye_030075 [Dipteronia dyeriana]